MQSLPEVVSLGATINADEARLANIAAAAARVDDWPDVAVRAESEGIAPILYHHLDCADAARDTAGIKPLRALAVRHRHATGIRIAEFARLSAAMDAAGIDSAALKGVALAGLIYPRPGLRPMRDIDFLVRPAQAGMARGILEDHGYRFEADQPSRYMRYHHHLPNARKLVDGLTVSVEVHIRANSGDTPGRLTLDNLDDPLQDVVTDAGAYRALGHIDMLNQLCRHALEPGTTIRLVSVMDIQGYCARFDDDIDWAMLARRQPYIANFLGLLDLVTPLPPSLERFAYRGRAIENPGRLIPTVSEVFARPGRVRGLMELLAPPEWWFRSYYGVDDAGRGAYRARVRHLYRLGVWMSRRLASSMADRRRVGAGEKLRRMG